MLKLVLYKGCKTCYIEALEFQGFSDNPSHIKQRVNYDKTIVSLKIRLRELLAQLF